VRRAVETATGYSVFHMHYASVTGTDPAGEGLRLPAHWRIPAGGQLLPIA